MKNVVFFIGSRANYGRLISVIEEFKKDKEIEVYIIGACTFNQVSHKLHIDHYISADMYRDVPGNRANTISLVAMNTTAWLMSNKMDYAIVHGDRFECLGFAIAANSNEVPLIHMEAGETTKIDNDTRWAITALSKIHMCPTFISYSRMSGRNMYEPHNVGSPVVDYINDMNFEKTEKKQILILYNPNTMVEFEDFIYIIEHLIIKFFDFNFVWVNPNIDPGNKDMVNKIKHLWQTHINIEFVKNLDLDQYLNLLYNSIFMIGNSSSGIKEGHVLGVPYLMYGTRQGARQVFYNTESFYDKKKILERASDIIRSYISAGLIRYKYDGILGNGDTSKKVLEIVKKVQE